MYRGMEVPQVLEYRQCPLCGAKVAVAYQSDSPEPFTSHSPYAGLIMWGPYSAEKQVLCQNERFVHFVFGDGEHRLVRLA